MEAAPEAEAPAAPEAAGETPAEGENKEGQEG
jgi:hypothetical protein